jgi:DNA-binding NarL/FixJ family response regulator
MNRPKISVGIVDDHQTTRESLAAIVDLDPDMKCVKACGSGEEALKLLPEAKPDVVLMDIVLPTMSGIECASRLKEQLPTTEIVMITVYEDPDMIFGALRAGACGYLLKRAPAEQVTAAIREARNGGAPMTAEIARRVITHFRSEAQASANVETLSTREREILDLVARGFTDKEISQKLCVTPETVRWHLKHCYRKLHVRSRTEAAMKLWMGNRIRGHAQ